MTYNEFVNWLDSNNAKQQQCLYPPDPRNNTTLIFHNGWYRRSDVAVVSIKTAAKRRRKGWSDWDSLTTPYGAPNPARVQRVSVSAVCRKYGVGPNVYYQRRHIGWSLLESLGLKVRNEQCGKPKVQQRMISAEGKRMPLNAWAAKLGVHPRVIHSRLALGWSEHDAVTTPKRVQTAKADKQPRKPRELRLVTVQGFTGTITEVADHYGISPMLLRSRIAANWPDETLLLGKGQRAYVSRPWKNMEAVPA